MAKIDIPLAYGPAFEGERVRKDDLYLEMGGGKTQCTELCKMAEMNEIEDGKVDLVGPDVKDVKKGSRLPLGIYVQVAGRKMQTDFEPILERQIHHLINYAQGIMHIGQRDIAWIRVGEQAVEKGFSLKHIGIILHAKFHQDFRKHRGQGPGDPLHEERGCGQAHRAGEGEYKTRDERVEKMTDEAVETYYSCTLCQSFAPSHVCIDQPGAHRAVRRLQLDGLQGLL